MKGLFLFLLLTIILTGCTCRCVSKSKVVDIRAELVPSFGEDDIYYHYKFENGAEKISRYDNYYIGEEVCLKNICE